MDLTEDLWPIVITIYWNVSKWINTLILIFCLFCYPRIVVKCLGGVQQKRLPILDILYWHLKDVFTVIYILNYWYSFLSISFSVSIYIKTFFFKWLQLVYLFICILRFVQLWVIWENIFWFLQLINFHLIKISKNDQRIFTNFN